MPLAPSDILKLKRWNTPTIANALEQISRSNPLEIVNLEETRDFSPEMGPMVGRAMTLVISGSNPAPKRDQPQNFRLYREYLASVTGPKIVVVQDVDHPACYGSIWGEVGANMARSFGCVGTITDGAIRDLDEMKNAGFKPIARRLAVSHAHCWPLSWGGEVEVFGTKVRPGQLIHADKHGFILIPEDAEDRLVEAARFMDDAECETVIAAGRQVSGKSSQEMLAQMQAAAEQFGAKTTAQYGRRGEW
jgi:4-hydroxy-4-methyl-2-oxoglutarate aldolase